MSIRQFLALAARIVIPAFWLGIIFAIDGFEAPLKFQAPGITIPLGLGIGKLVFTAMNATEGLLAILLLISVWATRRTRPALPWLGTIVGLLLFKVAVVRPVLNGYTDAVVAGTATPGSFMHYIYIAVDAILVVTLLGYLWIQARTFIRPASMPGEPTPADTRP